MSQLTYASGRVAGILIQGTAEKLGARMMRLRKSATLRSNRGAVIGSSSRCDGACGGQCRGWHVWYDPSGDELTPEDT